MKETTRRLPRYCPPCQVRMTESKNELLIRDKKIRLFSSNLHTHTYIQREREREREKERERKRERERESYICTKIMLAPMPL